MSEIKLCNGSFIASLQKGKDGKQNWTYTPVLSRLGKKIVPEGSLKETPQLDVQYDIESSSKEMFNSTLKNVTLDIVKFLLSSNKESDASN